jgi:hypothetical protein
MRLYTKFVGPDAADTLVKTGHGFVSSIVLSWKGVTAGEFATLIDGTTVAGSDIAVFYFPAANGSQTFSFGGDGLEFETGIFFNKGATAGKIAATLQFR